MSIKEITSFMTTDGKLYHSEEDAESHQAILDLKEIFNKDPILDHWGSGVEFKPVLEFFLKNADIIRRIL